MDNVIVGVSVTFTVSSHVTVISILSPTLYVPFVAATDDNVGLETSYDQENWVAAELPLPAESVNLSAATSIVAAPSAVGVNVAVYVVPLPEKELNVPFDNVISPTTKFVVDSLDVKVNDKLPVKLPPLEICEAVIVIVGFTPSTIKFFSSSPIPARDPAAPGDGNVNVTGWLPGPFMVPPLRVNALVEV